MTWLNGASSVAGISILVFGCSNTNTANLDEQRPVSGAAGAQDTEMSPRRPELAPCGPSEYELVSESTDKERHCVARSQCGDDEFEETPPTATDDRQCRKIGSPCAVGQVQVAAPSSTTDRVCVDCRAGEYCPGGEQPLVWCQQRDEDGDPSTPCASLVQFSSECSLDSNGRIDCRERDYRGGAPSRTEPLVKEGIVKFKTDSLVSCVLLESGQVSCWGFNGEHYENLFAGLGPLQDITWSAFQVCGVDGQERLRCHPTLVNTNSVLSPLDFTLPPWPHAPIVQMVGTRRRVCALDDLGSVRCWGHRYDLLGNLPDNLGHVVQLAADGSTICSLNREHQVRCWSTSEYSEVPWTEDPPEDLNAPIDISVHDSRACAVEQGGSVYCWGYEFGKGSTKQRYYWKSPALKAISAPGGACALLQIGGIECTGRSTVLADEWPDPSSFPQGLSVSAEDWVAASNDSIGAEPGKACPDGQFARPQVESDANPECRPYRECSVGQQGFPPVDAFSDRRCRDCTPGQYCAGGAAAPIACGVRDRDLDPTTPCPEIAQLAVRGSYVCTLDTEGAVDCFSGTSTELLATPPPLQAIDHIGVGRRSACAVDGEGLLTCWGPGTANGEPLAVAVTNGTESVRQILVAESRAYVLTASGTVSRWYLFNGNQLSMPVTLPGVTTQLTSSGTEFCALSSEGEVKCWGDDGIFANDNGQTDVPEDLGVAVQVSTSSTHTCALLENGAIECWGAAGAHLTAPTTVEQPVEVGVGANSTCVREQSGTVRCWGEQDELRPIDAARTPYDLPQARALATSNSVHCIITMEGALDCWGNAPRLTVPRNVGDECASIGGVDVEPGIICATGHCSVTGQCLQCLNDEHCGGNAAPFCDTATGACVQCLEASQCEASECQQATCENNVCGSVAGPPAISCSSGVCNGQGACAECLDNTHCNDGLPVCETTSQRCVACATGSDCPAPDQQCTISLCSTDNQCLFTGAPAGTPCETGVCNISFNCVECVRDEHCQQSPVGPVCDETLETCAAL